MAQLHQSAVTLRIIGDDLIPDEITELLGGAPTHAQTKGGEIIGKTGRIRIASKGMWRLCTLDREPGDIDAQIYEILSQITDDLAVWRTLAEKYRVDLFCGLFLQGTNEGLILSASSLAALGTRGIEMGVDIYGPIDQNEANKTRHSNRH